MRLKYPHIAIGALASSAPILQFEDIVPTETFYDIVSNDFRRESSSCFNTIKESWGVLMSIGQKQNDLLELTKTFHLCRFAERLMVALMGLALWSAYLKALLYTTIIVVKRTALSWKILPILAQMVGIGRLAQKWLCQCPVAGTEACFKHMIIIFSSFQDWCWKELNARKRCRYEGHFEKLWK